MKTVDFRLPVFSVSLYHINIDILEDPIVP